MDEDLNDGVERHELRLRVVNQPGTLHVISAIWLYPTFPTVSA